MIVFDDFQIKVEDIIESKNKIKSPYKVGEQIFSNMVANSIKGKGSLDKKHINLLPLPPEKATIIIYTQSISKCSEA